MVHLNVGEPVSGGAYALPHGHTQGSHGIRAELWHLMKIIFHCQETHLNISSYQILQILKLQDLVEF